MPEGVLYDPSLSDKAVRVYGALLRHGSDPTNCYPSHDRIARLIGCSKRSVARPLDELEKGGWVERAKRYDANGARTSDGYMVRVNRVPDAQESATTTQENVDPPRTAAGGHHAQERDERESFEREPLNDPPLPPNEPGRGLALVPPAASTTSTRTDVDTVWDAWKEATGHHKAKLDTKRERVILRALQDYPVADCVDAVRGWRHSPHHAGQNKTRTVYDDISLLLRDADHIERFRDLERGDQAAPAARQPKTWDGLARVMAQRNGDATA